jgi:hypothetical protein
MSDILSDSRHFADAKREEIRQATQIVAFRLSTGIDLDAALAAGPAELTSILSRLDRLIERERQRGCRRHWSYDLNRHIALAQAAERLRKAAGIARTTKQSPPARMLRTARSKSC